MSATFDYFMAGQLGDQVEDDIDTASFDYFQAGELGEDVVPYTAPAATPKKDSGFFFP